MGEGSSESKRTRPADDFVGPPERRDTLEQTTDEFVGPPEPPARRSPRRVLVAAASLAVLVLLSFGVGLLRTTPPTAFLDDLKRAEADTEAATAETEVGIDPEQAAFTEEALPPALDESLARMAAERAEAQRVADFTDLDLIDRLAGAWVLDLGYEGRVDVGFGTRPLRTVARARWDVTLFDLAGAVGAPYYSVLRLPDNRRLLAFLDADGRFVRVLDRVSVGDDVMTYTLTGSRRRHEGFRRGLAPRRGPDAAEPGAESSEPLQGADRVDSREAPARAAPPDPRRIPSLRRSPAALWDEARRLRRTDRFHTLRRVLDQLLRSEPEHRPAREWRGEVDRWIAEQADDLEDEVIDHLEVLADALGDREPRRALRLWRRPDDRTRERVRSIVDRSRDLEVRVRLLGIATRDAAVEFEALLFVESRDNRLQTSLEEIRWTGRYEDGAFTAPLR